MATEIVDRASGISGTDIAAIVGVSPYRTRFDIYAQKRGLVDPALAFKPTNRMRVGKAQEPTIVKLFEEDYAPLKVQWLDRTIRHHKDPIVIGTPDGLIDTPNGETVMPDSLIVKPDSDGFEAKTAGLDQAWRWGDEDSDVVPEEYIVQCAWYMILTGRKFWWVAVLIGGDRFKAYRLTQDTELSAILVDEAKRFWTDHIEKGVQPELDHSQSAKQYLRDLYPHATPKELRDAVPEELEMMREYTRVLKEAKFIKKRKDALGNQIRAAVGSAYGIAGDGMKAIWYDVAGSTYSVTRQAGRTLRLTDKRRSDDDDTDVE